MSDEQSTKPVKKMGWLKATVAVLTAVLLVYGAFITVVNRNLANQRDQRQKEALALSQLPGQACGVLSPELAKATIGEPIKQAARNSQTTAYEDGCTYTDPANSGNYASLVIKTYPTQQDAAEAYAKERALRTEAESRDPGDNGDEMYYSSATFFVLKGNKTIAVGAAKTGIDSSQQEVFSKKLLENTIKNI
jgi:hypothetical protein